MEYIRILTCKAMTTDEIWVRILIYNDCGTEKFLNVFFPVKWRGRESNPVPLVPQAKSLTTRPPLLQGLKKRIQNRILHVQFERKISVSQSNLLYL